MSNETNPFKKAETNKTNNNKKHLSINMDQTSNIKPNSEISSQKKVKSQNYVEIENILKNANKSSLKKYSTNLDKKINYLKNKNTQKNGEENNQQKKNIYINSHKIKKLSTEITGESTYQNQKMNKTKMYEEIIKKNMPTSNNIYYKYTNRNMSFKLKKDLIGNEQTIKSPLESLRSKSNNSSNNINLKNNNINLLNNNKGNAFLNYQKFINVFLIINDNISISTNTMVKNTNNNFMKLLSFLNNTEILNLFLLNRNMRSGIIGCLVYKVKEKILPDFTRFYCNNVLFNDDYNFMIASKFSKKNKSIIRFILSIKPRITKNNKKIINKRFKIGYSEYANNKYNSNNNKNQIQLKQKRDKIFTTYLFEIIDKNTPKNFWVFKENTSFHYDENFKAYYNDIMQFRPGDNALINISLISELGIIDFDNIFWFKPKMENIKEINTHKCEVEKMIYEWDKIDLLEKGDVVQKNLNDLFSENFIIKEIYYDDVGYFFFKIILKAYKIGICSGKEGNLGIKIHILPIGVNITNEIKKNGLIYDENNELSINVGDKITFYISQNKA